MKWLESLLDRQVRIFKPTRSPTQQGKYGTRLWRIDFDILEDGNRWENPLMGWASRYGFIEVYWIISHFDTYCLIFIL